VPISVKRLLPIRHETPSKSVRSNIQAEEPRPDSTPGPSYASPGLPRCRRDDTPREQTLRRTIKMQCIKCHRLLRRLAKSTSKIESKPMNNTCMSDVKHYLSNILEGSGLRLVIALFENSGFQSIDVGGPMRSKLCVCQFFTKVGRPTVI
jgi:hypothetical protein